MIALRCVVFVGGFFGMDDRAVGRLEAYDEVERWFGDAASRIEAVAMN